MDEFKVDGGLAAVIIFMISGAFAGVMKIFNVGSRLEKHDIHLAAHERRMEEIEAHMEDSHHEIKDLVKSNEAKLDRLIEKLIPQSRSN